MDISLYLREETKDHQVEASKQIERYTQGQVIDEIIKSKGIVADVAHELDCARPQCEPDRQHPAAD